MGSYLLKAPDADLARWRAAAEKEGVKFAEFVRTALDARTRHPPAKLPAQHSLAMFSRDVTPDPRPTSERRSSRR